MEQHGSNCSANDDLGSGGTWITLLPSRPSLVIAARRNAGLYEIDIAPDVALQTGTTQLALNERAPLTFNVVNQGPYAVSNTRFLATLPASFINPTFASSNGTCTYTAPQLTCTWGAMQVNSSASVTVTAMPTSDTDAISASVSAYEPDVAPSNNSVIVPARRIADLRIGLTTSKASVGQEDSITYTLAIANNGPSTAAGVSATLTYPASARVSGTVPIGCTAGAGSILCQVPDLNPSTSHQITIGMAFSQAGGAAASASVSHSGTDPSTDNNSSSATITVQPQSSSSGGGGGAMHWWAVLMLWGMLAVKRR